MRGSLTAEASVVLPFFLMAIMAILSFMELMQIQTRIQQGMRDAVGRAAGYYYFLGESPVQEIGGDDGAEIAQILLRGGITAAYLQQKTVESAGKEYLDKSWIVGGSSGLTALGSVLPDMEGNLDLAVTYRVKIPFLPGSFGTVMITQREFQRVWMGNEDAVAHSEENDSDETVFITENGKVYHTSLTCSYLKLSIQQVELSAIDQYRSEDGSKYYACELCNAETASGTVYITDSGNRYHININCSGLKRGIQEVLLSSVSDMPCCSRCSAKK